jgi:hypothetical protein
LGEGEMSEEHKIINPEEYMSDVENALGWLVDVIEKLDKVELTLRQKSQIVGMMVAIMQQFYRLNKKFVEWGYLSEDFFK